jgi:hypothetical protein
MRLFSPALSIFLLFLPLPALAEEGWEEVKDTLYEGKEVVLLPLQSEISSEFLEEQPPPQPELHFNGAQADGGSVAQATLAFPPISVGEQGIIFPFLALKGQDDGTRQGQSVVIEGGVIMSLGDIMQLKISGERTIHPFPDTSLQVSGSFHF